MAERYKNQRVARATLPSNPSRGDSPHCYAYPRPSLTVDSVVFRLRNAVLETLLIQRGGAPFRGRWAIPGGFVEPEEPLQRAAARELQEETGVHVARLWPVGGFGDPGRDPRGWTVSIAYYGFDTSTVAARAGDDARALAWHAISRLGRLAFDHKDILAAAQDRMQRDLYVLPIAQPLMPAHFSIAELRRLYHTLDRRAPGLADLERILIARGIIRRVKARSAKVFQFIALP